MLHSALITSAVDGINSIRHTAVIALLATLLALTVVQVAVILMEAFCPPRRRPTRSTLYCLFGPILTVVTVLLVALLWIGACILLATVTVQADFCVDADNNVLNVTHQRTQSVTVYFVSV